MQIGIRNTIINSLVLLGLIFSFGQVYAEETEPALKPSPPASSSDSVEVMDKTAPSAKEYLLQDLDSGLIYEGLQKMENFQVWLGGHVQETSELIDDYFGTQESFEYARGSRLDVMTPVIFHDSGQVEMSLRMRAKLAFPKIAKRWHLLITSEDTSVKGQVNSDLARDVTEEEGTASLGFQVMLEEYDKLATLLDFGLNFQNIIDPDPYVRLKKRYEWQLKNDWTSRMSQNLFWERVAGPGLESKLVFDHELDEVYLFRSQTDGVWWHDDGYYDLIERFLLYQRVNPHRLLTYQLRFDWDTQGPGFHNTDYGVAVNWREKAYKNWLYFEIEPGVRFTEENDFAQADLTLMLMLEMRFYSRI